MSISIKIQKNELRVNFYTPVLNTKQNQMDDNKANTNNPILKFDLESGLSVEFRAFGPNNNVGFVVRNNGETTFNSLIDNEGNFISSKINEKDLKILTGETSIQCPANESTTKTVTFPEAFSETPVVFLSPVSGVPNATMLSTTGVIRSEFVINAWRGRDDPINIKWVAIGK